MKKALIAAAVVLLAGVPAMAQSSGSSQDNASALGTQTAPGNSSGDPSAGTPQGAIATTQVAPAAGGADAQGSATTQGAPVSPK